MSNLIITDPFSIQLGDEFEIELRLQVEVDGLGSADFFGTTALTKIVVSGGPAPSTATGSSGTSYTALLPEPGGLPLAALALAAIALRRRVS